MCISYLLVFWVNSSFPFVLIQHLRWWFWPVTRTSCCGYKFAMRQDWGVFLLPHLAYPTLLFPAAAGNSPLPSHNLPVSSLHGYSRAGRAWNWITEMSQKKITSAPSLFFWWLGAQLFPLKFYDQVGHKWVKLGLNWKDHTQLLVCMSWFTHTSMDLVWR